MEIKNWKKTLLPYEQAVNELIIKFEALSNEYNKFNTHSPIEEIIGRVKSVGSILEKANRKNIPYEEIEEKIDDIAGVRIICRFVEDIEKVVELIRNRDGLDLYIKTEKDYITNTKKSGYRSYHIIISYPLIMSTGPLNISCEIQIRTLAMNFWATIEHSLKYKYNNNLPKRLQERLQASAEAAFILDKEMGKIRGEILEAQKIITTKNSLVDSIIKKMGRLHLVSDFNELNELNKEFVEIYSEENLDRLKQFNEKLNVLIHLYYTVKRI